MCERMIVCGGGGGGGVCVCGGGGGGGVCVRVCVCTLLTKKRSDCCACTGFDRPSAATEHIWPRAD